MAGQQDYLLKLKIEADAKDLEAKLRRVQAQLGKFGDDGAQSAKKLQTGFKSFASEASNVAAIFTGDRLSGVTSQITSMGNALGAIPGPAGLAIGAIAGIGTAAAGIGVALFELTKKASDFGSTIHDASIKTGLGAETISTLKLAADQSGTSLEQVTSGIAKFQKNIAAAGEDAKKSAAFVKDFGFTPQEALRNLDGSLEKVFQKIGDTEPTHRAALAMKAFGKSGAELVPTLEQTGFSLEEYKKQAGDLVGITDKDAAAADAFGDQMVLLDAQLAGVGRTIGFELMPEFQVMISEFSTWLKQNKSEVEWWGKAVHTVFNEVIYGARMVKWAVSAPYNAVWGGGVGDIPKFDNPFTHTASAHADAGGIGHGRAGGDPGDSGGGKGGKSAKDSVKETVSEITKAMSNPQVLAFFSALSTIEGGGINTVVGGRKSSLLDPRHPGAYGMGMQGPAGRSTAAGLYQETYSNWKRLASTLDLSDFRDPKQQLKLALYLFQEASGGKGLKALLGGDFEAAAKLGTQPWAASPYSTLPGNKRRDFLSQVNSNLASGKFGEVLETPEQKLAKQKKEDDDFMAEAERSLQEWINAEKEASGQRLDIRNAEADLAVEILKGQLDRGNIDEVEYAERTGQLVIDNLKDQRAEVADQISSAENINKIHILDLEIEKAKLQTEQNITNAIRHQQKTLEELGGQYAGEDLKGVGGFAKPDRRSQFDQLIEGVNGNKLETAGIEAARDAFQGLGEAVGQAVEALVLYGTAGGSAREVTARIIASVAQQAAVKAIFELAEGFAALARGIFGMPNAHAEAIMHFKSAATYGIVAGVAAGIGRGVAGDSLKQGGTAGGANGAAGGGNQVNQNPDPYSRASENAYLSGRRTDPALLKTLDRIDRTLNKYESAKPGDVLMRGIAQKPGAIGNANVNDMKRNAGIGRAMRQVSGGG